jgi:hypothetical protein
VTPKDIVFHPVLFTVIIGTGTDICETPHTVGKTGK